MRTPKTYHLTAAVASVLLACLLSSVLYPTLAAAQTKQSDYEASAIAPQALDSKDWESARKGLSYEDDTPPPPERTRRQTSPAATQAWATLFKVFAILLAIGLVVLILYHMLGGAELFKPRNRRVDGALTTIDLKHIEENLEASEIDDYILQAEKNGQYAMAVRLQYLALIKLLSERNAIRWKRDKTNGAYLREIAALPFSPAFLEVTRVFEKIWYGAHPIDPAGYRQLAQRFSGLGQTIKNWRPQ